MGKDKRKRRKTPSESVTPLIAPLLSLQRLLSKFDDRGVIIGGIAASLLGTPRYTVDLDVVFLLSFVDISRFIQEANVQGFEPRISDPIEFARQTRVLLLKHIDSGVDVDISLGILPFEEEMVARSQLLQVGELSLRLPTPEDLIIMKAVAHRPKDLEDIRAVAASHPGLDKERIRFWVEQFGEALVQPELWIMIQKLL